MAAPISNTRIRTPPGFSNLLESVTKEVLRYQPEDIHMFCYNFFSDLLKLRDETKLDLVEVCAQLEDRYYNNRCFETHHKSDVQKREEALVESFKERQSKKVEMESEVPEPAQNEIYTDTPVKITVQEEPLKEYNGHPADGTVEQAQTITNKSQDEVDSVFPIRSAIHEESSETVEKPSKETSGGTEKQGAALVGEAIDQAQSTVVESHDRIPEPAQGVPVGESEEPSKETSGGTEKQGAALVGEAIDQAQSTVAENHDRIPEPAQGVPVGESEEPSKETSGGTEKQGAALVGEAIDQAQGAVAESHDQIHEPAKGVPVGESDELSKEISGGTEKQGAALVGEAIDKAQLTVDEKTEPNLEVNDQNSKVESEPVSEAVQDEEVEPEQQVPQAVQEEKFDAEEPVAETVDPIETQEQEKPEEA